MGHRVGSPVSRMAVPRMYIGLFSLFRYHARRWCPVTQMVSKYVASGGCGGLVIIPPILFDCLAGSADWRSTSSCRIPVHHKSEELSSFRYSACSCKHTLASSSDPSPPPGTMSTFETVPACGKDAPPPSFVVFLFPVALDEDDNRFQVENTSLEDWQREAVIERTGAIDISCDLIGVLHGWYGEKSNGGPFATLVVFRFRFDPQKHARRVIRCNARVEFWPMPDDATKTTAADSPRVVAIAPSNRLDMVLITDLEEVKKGLTVDLALSGVPFLTASVRGSFERSKTRDNRDAMTVSGNISLAPGVNSGPRNCAGWTLLENATRTSGLLGSLCVAMLVLWKDRYSKFKGMIRV